MKLLTKEDAKNSNKLIVLYGPPKVGKSIAACTISEYCPPVIPAKESTTLTDILVINYDRDGRLSYDNTNLYPYFVDYFGAYALNTEIDPTLPTSKRALETAAIAERGKALCKTMISDLFNTINEAVKNPDIKTIVIDTLSSFEEQYRRCYDPFASLDGKELGAQTYLTLSAIAARLVDIHHKNVIVVCHAKASEAYVHGKADEEKLEKAALKREVASVGGSGSFVSPALQKNSAALFGKHATFLFYVFRKEKDPEKGKRLFLTRSDSGYEAGNKIENGLLPEEPANLRAILKKANLI